MENIKELVSVFTMGFTLGLSGAVMPGPLLAFTISKVPAHGGWAGPRIILGHMILEMTFVTLLALGLATYFQSVWVTIIIGLVGGITMLVMGIKMIVDSKDLRLDIAAGGDPNAKGVIAGGIFISLANPYWTIWWTTIGLSCVICALGMHWKWAALAAFFVGHILSDFAWYSFISFGLHRGKRLMSDRIYRNLIRVCAVAMVGFGIWFFVTGINKYREPDQKQSQNLLQ